MFQAHLIFSLFSPQKCVEFVENSNELNEGDEVEEIESYGTHEEENVPNHETVKCPLSMKNVPYVLSPVKVSLH